MDVLALVGDRKDIYPQNHQLSSLMECTFLPLLFLHCVPCRGSPGRTAGKRACVVLMYRWILQLHCSGGRNVLGALRRAFECDDLSSTVGQLKPLAIHRQLHLAPLLLMYLKIFINAVDASTFTHCITIANSLQ